MSTKPWMPDPRKVRPQWQIALRPASNESQFDSAFVPLKDRPEPKKGDRVRVYRNLNNGQYSVVALQGPYKGLVLGYAPAIGLEDVSIYVSEKTRNKVVEKGVRHVHAWCQGKWIGCSDLPPHEYTAHQIRVTYMPFVKKWFFLRTAPDKPITRLESAWAFQADLWLSKAPEQ